LNFVIFLVTEWMTKFINAERKGHIKTF
jgi:hypothetical protein